MTSACDYLRVEGSHGFNIPTTWNPASNMESSFSKNAHSLKLSQNPKTKKAPEEDFETLHRLRLWIVRHACKIAQQELTPKNVHLSSWPRTQPGDRLAFDTYALRLGGDKQTTGLRPSCHCRAEIAENATWTKPPFSGVLKPFECREKVSKKHMELCMITAVRTHPHSSSLACFRGTLNERRPLS